MWPCIIWVILAVGVGWVGAYVAMAFLMYVMNGLANVSMGSVLPLLMRHYDVSYAMGGQWVFLQFSGFLVGVWISSLLVRCIGPRMTLIVASLSIAIAELAIGFLPSPPLIAIMCLLNGFGLASTQTTIATSIMQWFEGRRAVVMSRLEVAFGLGSLLMPVIASALISMHIWAVGFWSVALISLALGVSWLFVPINPESDAKSGPRDAQTVVPHLSGTKEKLTLMILFLSMIFVYVGLESCLNNFLPSIFVSYVKVNVNTASLTVTVFWISMVIGRTLTGWVVRKVPYVQFLLWSIVGTLLLLTALPIWHSGLFAFSAIFLVGLTMSGIFVITLVYANHAFPDQSGVITKLVTAFAGIGGAAVPGLFGWLMDRFSVRDSMWFLTGFTLILLIQLIVIIRVQVVTKRSISVTV